MARLIDRLRPPPVEQRYSFNDYVSWVTSGTARFPSYGGSGLPGGLSFTWGSNRAEAIETDFVGLVDTVLKRNGVVAACEMVRMAVFSEARFQWQRIENGRPTVLFGTRDLAPLERPWPGGTTGDLLARMIVDADVAGNHYSTFIDGELVRLRPDWVEILLAPRMLGRQQVGFKRVGYAYHEGGQASKVDPVVLLPEQVCHFAPIPDPVASYRGMSWMTPVVREIASDSAATSHKLKFFENAATPNLAVSLAKEITPEQFDMFVEAMDRQHKGVHNAYKTLYTAGGADVTVIGSNLQQLDFKTTQGAGETRIAAAAGVPPVIVGLSEGLQGSSLNAGNFGQARRRFADGTLRPLWRNAAGSLEVLIKPPGETRLWYDDRDIPFLRDDAKDVAEIQQTKANAIRSLGDAGYEPDSVTDAIESDDFSRLKHSGMFSVQLQQPGVSDPASPPGGKP